MAKTTRKKEHKFWNEFKTFISRGNMLNLAVGVVIGSAFNAVVTALTNILLSICTWAVPGGLSGLVTVLPAVTAAQKPANGWNVVYSLAEYQKMIDELASDGSASLFISSYTQHGNNFYYNGVALIDWGAFINAIISFLIIGLTLFIIVKVYQKLSERSKELKAKALEEYYKHHPEARPEEIVQAPAAPEITEKDLLQQILIELKKQNTTSKTPIKEEKNAK